MNLKQIETFLWIARLGSFAAAADRLNTTQSAVSARIQELEMALGVKLLERGRRAAQLTAKGQELMVMAEELMEQVRRIKSSVGKSDAMSGFLRLGIADLIALTWLSEFVREVRKRYPMITLDLRIGLAMDLIAPLRAGELDVVLTPGGLWLSEFEAVPLGASEFHWMVHRDWPGLNGPLTPRDLQSCPIITLSQQSYHHRIINQWFRDNSANARNFIECNSISVIVSLTLSGLGIGLVPRVYVGDELARGDLRILQCEPAMEVVRLYALMRADRCHPIGRRIALMAQEISPFCKADELEREAPPRAPDRTMESGHAGLSMAKVPLRFIKHVRKAGANKGPRGS